MAAELVRNPKVMERATAEVRQAFAAHGSVREEKLVEAGLQYLPLVIQETLRLHTPLPFLIPQECQDPLLENTPKVLTKGARISTGCKSSWYLWPAVIKYM